MLALHSPKRLAEAETTAGFAGSSTSRSMLNSVSTHSFSTSRMASTRPTLTPRSVTGAPTPRPPTVRKRACAEIFFWLMSVSLSHSAPADDQRQGQQHRQADGELVRAFHGRPSMNCRTTGSVGGLDLGLGPDLADAALVQHGDPVADAERAAHVVRDDESGHAQIAGAHHELVHDGGGDRIEPGGRLVIQNVARLERDGPRDADALPHSAAELGRVLGLGARQLDDREALLDPRRDGLVVGARASGGRARCSPPRSSSRTAPRTGTRSRSCRAAPRARPGPCPAPRRRPPPPVPASGSSRRTMHLSVTLLPTPE